MCSADWTCYTKYFEDGLHSNTLHSSFCRLRNNGASCLALARTETKRDKYHFRFLVRCLFDFYLMLVLISLQVELVLGLVYFKNERRQTGLSVVV